MDQCNFLHHAVQEDQQHEQVGEQQFQYDFSTHAGDDINDGHNNLFSVDHYTDAATYDESIAIAAAFADPAQPPQSLAVLQQQQTEQKQAAKKNIVGYVYKKAPGAPKRWKSSYIHFFTDFIARKKRLAQKDGACAKTDEEKLDMNGVAKEASKAWKEMPANEKQYWESISKKDREEYEKKLREFEGPLQVRTDKLKKKDLGAPKRSPPAFFLFVKVKGAELKEHNPKAPHGQIVKECGKFWRNMSDLEKAPYREEEQSLRAQYHIDMKKWKDARQKEEEEAQKKFAEERKKLIPMLQSDDPESVKAAAAIVATRTENALNPHHENTVQPVIDFSDNVPEKPRTRKRKYHQDQDDAPKRSPSAFFIFCNHHRERIKSENPEIPYNEVVSTLSKNWKAMTEDQRKPFRDREEELRQQYYFKMTHYKKTKRDRIKLKGGFDDQKQNESNVAESGGVDILSQAVRVDTAATTTEQEQQQQPLTFAPLPDDVQEVATYQQVINYQGENHDYQHDLSYADYNIEPINVSAAKTDGVEDESDEYNQHQISHQASIDYGAVGDYFGL